MEFVKLQEEKQAKLKAAETKARVAMLAQLDVNMQTINISTAVSYSKERCDAQCMGHGHVCTPKNTYCMELWSLVLAPKLLFKIDRRVHQQLLECCR